MLRLRLQNILLMKAREQPSFVDKHRNFISHVEMNNAFRQRATSNMEQVIDFDLIREQISSCRRCFKHLVRTMSLCYILYIEYV
jgi:hypothetical protein